MMFKVDVYFRNIDVINLVLLGIVNKSKKEGIDQESIQSSTTPDPGFYISGYGIIQFLTQK